MMDSTTRRDMALAHLRANYLGPLGGDYEFLRTTPNLTYLVGTLFAAESLPAADAAGDGELDPGNDDGVIVSANGWHPSSAALSFLHSGQAVDCSVSFGVYVEESMDSNKGWRRTPVGPFKISLSLDEPIQEIRESSYSIRVSSRWRAVGAHWLVTVALENIRPRQADERIVTEDTLFQIAMECSVAKGGILPYRGTDSLGQDHEEEELALRYRSKDSFAVGHGTAVDWELGADGNAELVMLAPLPTYEVPAIDPRESESDVVKLQFLQSCAEQPQLVTAALRAFVDEYAMWISSQDPRAGDIPIELHGAADRLIQRAKTTAERMNEGVELLLTNETARDAFSLAMTVMREQMIQSALVRSAFDTSQTPARKSDEPRWRPFQLGFLLLTLSSVTDANHPDRDVVDLIWFPTGGGKTEAYLALAAYEIFRRRLADGPRAGGTAVLTRYTLRLLTTQQFHRAATLICAMELLRKTDPRLRGMARFSIGLWVGNETTPGTVAEAKSRFQATLKKRDPDNPFQLDSCPWCGTSIMPSSHSEDPNDYGVLVTRESVTLRCRNRSCEFRDQLPVEVIDERIFDDPPTIVLATVDKFARLTFNERASRILGRSVPFNAPSLVIQDELHLLSGPLGTTVGLYETAVMSLVAISGNKPKVVASTATIRASQDQVMNLFAREVALYPAAGLNEDDSFFAKVSTTKLGRMYVGLMPQAFTQSTSVVRGLAPLLEVPFRLGSELTTDLDAYWTVVAYHNSLRELGRTVTLVRDDVSALLKARRHPSGASRSLRGDGLVELTSRVSPDDLPRELARLDARVESGHAVDVVASTNMLSVGIDVSRLAVMLMNGQPKTTSEYIQATSRVGRGKVPGIVVTLFRATKPRDRSHYELFRAHHQSLYRSVEPTSVTPWSVSSRNRSLAAVFVIMMRHGGGLSANSSAELFKQDAPMTIRVMKMITQIVERVDPRESEQVREQLENLCAEWASRIEDAKRDQQVLHFDHKDHPSLLKDFGEARPGWSTMSSMRSVDRVVRVVVRGED